MIAKLNGKAAGGSNPAAPPRSVVDLLGEERVIVPSVPVVELPRAKLDAGWRRGEMPLEVLLPDGSAPSEIRLFKRGENVSNKGTFLFDDEAGASVIALYLERGLELMADYEHMSLVDPPIVAPASAKSWVPEVRDDGLYATQIKWTDRARAMLEAGEYRFFSPAFRFDPKTMRVHYLINFALTNLPALNELRPLMAASSENVTTPATTTEKRIEMKKDMACTGCKASLKAPSDEGKDGDDAYCKACLSAAKEAATGHKILRTLSLSMDAGEVAVLSSVGAIGEFRTDVMKLTGKDTLPAALGVLQGWKEKADERDALSKELADLKYGKLSADFEAAVKAKVDGFFCAPPKAQEILAKAKGADGKYTHDRVEMATAFLSTMETKIASGEQTPAAVGTLQISETERAMALKMGKDPAEYATWKQTQIQAGTIAAR